MPAALLILFANLVGLSLFLTFKANVRRLPLFSQRLEVTQGAAEDAIMVGLVAGEAFEVRGDFDLDPIVFDRAGLGETRFPAAASTFGDPEVLGHFLHELGLE